MGDTTPGIPPDINLSHFPDTPSEMTERGVKRPSSDPAPSTPNYKKNITNLELSSASIETIYTHPSYESARSYSANDLGPFIVHLSRPDSDPASGTSLRSMKVGHFLKSNDVQNIVRGGVKSVGRNRVAVEFSSQSAANNFISHPCLSSYNMKASIPTYNVTRLGLVRNVPCEWSMSYLVEAVELPENCGKILKARRLNRKSITEGSTTWIPTQSVVMTFEGQILPKFLYCCYNSLPVEVYQLPTIQCHNCCRFGHIKAQCRSKARCYKCCQSHPGDSCNVEQNKITCLFCSGPHCANDRKCPEHARQKSIKMMMSDNNVSYIEASSQFPPVRRSFADVTTTIVPQGFPNFIPPKPTSILPTPISYRKTVYPKPRPKQTLSQGYDKRAHASIISNLPSSLPNGCAIDNSSNSSLPIQSNISNENLIDLLVSLLDNILMKFNDCLPSNVATKLIKLLSHIQHNGPDTTQPDPTMEQ